LRQKIFGNYVVYEGEAQEERMEGGSGRRTAVQ
jgi:hypothetical protein